LSEERDDGRDMVERERVMDMREIET